MKKRVILSFIVAIGVLTLFVVLVGWGDVIDAVNQTAPSTYVFAFAVMLVALAMRSMVWIHLLAVLKHDLSRLTIAGIFLSAKFFKYVSPYGQVTATPAIALYVSSFTEADYERNLAAIISADMFTYSPYYTFGAVGLAYVTLGAAPFPDVGVFLAGSAVIITFLILSLWLVLFRRHLTERLVVFVLSPIGSALTKLGIGFGEEFTGANLKDRIHGFYETVDVLLNDRSTLLAGLVYGHAAWLFLMLPLVITASAMGVELSIFLAMLIVALSKLGFIVPLPGGLGGVEFTIAGLLFLIAGVAFAQATAIAILYRFASYWLTVLVGGLATSAIILTWPGRETFFSG